MCVLRRDMKGEIRIGYQYIDAVLDFILSIGAKPMIEFGHMPGLLAEQPSQITMRPVQNAAPEAMTSEEKEMVCHSADPEYRVWRETVGEE